MPLKNYTTTIDVGVTIGEIQKRLWKNRATQVMLEVEDGEPTALRFVIPTPYGPRPFALPANIAGVQKVLAAELGQTTRRASRAHAARVAWRILRDWLDAQLALIETEMVTFEEIMLPYMIVDRDGSTLYEVLREHRLALQLPVEEG
jgi:hypothetical protein